MRRKILLIACAIVALLALTVAALPWWLGFALSRAGAARGLTFGRYERIGYARFALHDVEVRVAPVRVTLARVEADTPLVALWRRGEIVVGRWTVAVVNRDGPPPPATSARGWLPLRAQLQAVQKQLGRWAPRVSAEAGEVRWTGAALTCASAHWAEGALAVKDFGWRDARADLALTFPGEALRLAVSSVDGTATVESQGERVTGDVRWWEQRADVTAHFGASGWLPLEATLRADEWNVPGEKLRLGETYSAVRGRGHIDWREQKLTWEFTATGEPQAGKTVPPLAMTLRGSGAGDTITVESLQATLPGIAVQLSEPVTVGHDGKLRQGAARLAVEVDLAKQPWFTARGVVRGEARFVSALSSTAVPVVEFQLTARDIAAANWAASSVAAKARLEWPRFHVSKGTLVGPAGETLVWSGGWDFVTKEIFDAVLEGQIRPATVARWLPSTVTFETATLRITATGAPANLRHDGKIRAEAVKLGALNPLAMTAEWAGRADVVDTFSIGATAGTTTLSAGGSITGQSVRLTQLELVQGGTPRLALVAPAEVHWSPTLAADALALAGPKGRIEAAWAWGETGRGRLVVKNFSSEWLREFGVLPGPAWQLTSLTATGEWDRGPMNFSVVGAGTLDLGEGAKAAMAVSAQGDAAGLRIAELDVVENEKRVVHVAGNLPLRLRPGAVRWAEIEPDGALALTVTTEPSAEFWRHLTAITGLELKEPAARAQITGTWARPAGTAQVTVARLTADAARFTWPVPTIEALELSLAGDAQEVRLVQLSAKVEGQVFTASARLPMGAEGWRGLAATPRFWERSDLEVTCEVPGADLAALARVVPEFVAPRGRLEAKVSYRDGALGGALQLRDGATRRLGALGVLQEINAEVALAGRKADLSGTAHYGGQPLTLRGTVELPEPSATTAAPIGEKNGSLVSALRFDVALTGENLPLVRQTGMLVRADLDLKLTSPRRGPPLLAGTVRLRDSLLFSDVRALLPRGVRTRAQTPPYFAVELAPYAAWQLNVAIEGARFLKLRTALFNGMVSARFQLGGTLGVPSLRGEATIDEGAVKLPFATFVVQEGRVSLTPEQSSEPQVWLVGTVRRLNYDLRMEASGSAAAPALVFTSSPPLDSGQVLLMVMAGEPPQAETAYSDRQRVAQLGAFFGQSLLTSLAGDSEASERLSLSTGESISRQGRETYEIEYRLSERWALVGEYDEFDDFNAGLKWRVFSRGGQSEEPKKP